MRDGWVKLLLGDVFEANNARLGPHDDEPQTFAISKYAGVVLSLDYHDRRVASANLDSYKLLRTDDWAYSTIHIDEGSIARNTHGFGGVVSPMYTTLRWVNQANDPRYFETLLRAPQMLATYRDLAQGSINRRRSLPWRTFKAIAVDVPPLNEQRRIVDLISAVDDAIEAAEAVVLSGEACRVSVLARVLEGNEARVTIDSVLVHKIGGAWGSAAGVDECAVLALGPKSYSGGPTDVDLSTVTERSLSSARAEVRRLHPGDIILERSGGTPTQPVGRVLRMVDDAPNVVPSDFMRLLRVDSARADPNYVFWWMWLNYRAGLTVPFQSATTNIRNLNIQNYLTGTTIPLPDLREQQHRVELATALDDAQVQACSYREALHALRYELTTAVLSGEHEMPSSYDALMEGATS